MLLFEFYPSFVQFLIVSAVIPIFWNILARIEYNYGTFSRIFGNNRRACYAYATYVFTFSLYRDHLFQKAVFEQDILHPLFVPFTYTITPIVFVFGSTLVLSSMYKLGIHGTYMGDYFGIFLNKRVTSFPFNVVANPM
jgi:phosphatidylethanolamine N-methyltransferase